MISCQKPGHYIPRAVVKPWALSDGECFVREVAEFEAFFLRVAQGPYLSEKAWDMALGCSGTGKEMAA